MKIALILATFLLAAPLTSSKFTLNQNLKLAANEKQQKIQEKKTFSQRLQESGGILQNSAHSLQQDDEPIFKVYQKPFTASPYYDFFDAFLLGLKLETFFKGSESCINTIVYTADDMVYLYNNFTDFSWSSWEAPFMNLSKAISGNMSSSLVECYTMGVNAYTYGQTKFAQFGNNIGDFLLSFLFNLMGSALKFKSIFDEINNDIKNQNYADIANQYGRMIRIIFDFEPVSADSLATTMINLESEYFNGDKVLAQEFGKLVESIKSYSANVSEFKTVAAIKNKINQVYAFVEDYQTQWAQSNAMLQEFLHQVGIWQASAWQNPFAAFSWTTDIWNMLWGVVQGGVTVLPTTSMIAYCSGNATSLYPQALTIGTQFAALNFADGFKAVQQFTKYTHGTIFNCFYTVTNPVQAAEYNRAFTWMTIVWNVLFNLGFMYTNAKNVVMFFYYDSAVTPNPSFETLGKQIGSFFVRFIYSKYAQKTYYNF